MTTHKISASLHRRSLLRITLIVIMAALLLWPAQALAKRARLPLVGVEVSPAAFYGGAGASGVTELSYTIDQNATVAVLLRDKDGVTIGEIQPETAQQAGNYTVTWNGTGPGGVNLAEGPYYLVLAVSKGATTLEVERQVTYSFTPVASEASLALDGAAKYVLHTVVEKWDESANDQMPGDYYADGQIQPWEFDPTDGASVTLYVGTSATNATDTTFGGMATGTSDSRGVADLAFPADLSWQDEQGAPRALYYSVALTYAGSTRCYPAIGRYPLRPPVQSDGHLQFAYMSDIQTPSDAAPTPDLPPSALTSETGPYTAVPRLSRSLGWATVLPALLQESSANLVLFGGDLVDSGGDAGAPDDGGTQYRTIFDNQQTFGPADEWSLSSLTKQMPIVMAAGNHDDIGNGSGLERWRRWAYAPDDKPYYTFDQGDVHFVVIDGYSASDDSATNFKGWIGFQSNSPGGTRTVSVGGQSSTFTNSAQADWLIGAIDTAKPWTVVVMHYPMFDSYRTTNTAYNNANTTGKLTSNNKYYYGERDRLLAFFAAHGVDVVLHGHNHNYRRHVEKVHAADGTTATMAFITQATAGASPMPRDTDQSLPYIDWVDLNGNGTPDASEPVATAENNPFWDASAFGQWNWPVQDASGYISGTPDMFHAYGQEYTGGVRFSYSMFETGEDAQGQPTLTMTVKTIMWNSSAHRWTSWSVYDATPLQQVSTGMVADRLSPPPKVQITKTADDNEVPETGQDVKFTFLITNTGPRAITVTSLVDDKFGDLLGTAQAANGGSPIALAPAASFSFDVTRSLASDALTPHVNRVDVAASDGARICTDWDDETVTFTDVAPVVDITKTADDNEVPETGQDVTFTFAIDNTGAEEFTVTSLVDDKFGDLLPAAEAANGSAPIVLAPGAGLSFDLTRNLSSDTLAPHVNRVDVTVADEEGTGTDWDDETVTFTDVPEAGGDTMVSRFGALAGLDTTAVRL